LEVFDKWVLFRKASNSKSVELCRDFGPVISETDFGTLGLSNQISLRCVYDMESAISRFRPTSNL